LNLKKAVSEVLTASIIRAMSQLDIITSLNNSEAVKYLFLRRCDNCAV
jgi:hypothetical protein